MSAIPPAEKGQKVLVRTADLQDQRDVDCVLEMTRAYARDPMARGDDLPQDTLDRLADEMRSHPAFLSFLAFDGERPVGVANCLVSFSTFRAKRLLNIHDFCVVPAMRGRGVSRQIMSALESYARENGFAGVTLEVKGKNHHARDVYKAMGFSGSRAAEDDCYYFCFKAVE